MVKRCSRLLGYLIELNIILLIFSFSTVHLCDIFNDLWKSLLVIWVVRKLISKDPIPIPPSCIFLFAFTGAVLLSCILSQQPHLSFDKIDYLIYGMALSIVVYDLLNHDEGLPHRIGIYFIMSAVITSADAVIHQVVSGKGFRGFTLSGSRATGFFSNPFYLALWSGIGLFLTIFRLIEAHARTSRLVYLTFALILGAAFLFSKTRAPWIAMGIVLLLSLLYTPDKKGLLKVIFILGIVTLILLIFDDATRVRAISIVGTKDTRWIIWENCLIMIRENFTLADWFFGRGPGLFKLEYAQLDLTGLGKVYTFPHMILFELFYATGLLGVLTFIFWFFDYTSKLLSALKDDSSNLLARQSSLIPLLTMLISFINIPFFSRYFSFPFWFFVGASPSLLCGKRKPAIKKLEESLEH